MTSDQLLIKHSALVRLFKSFYQDCRNLPVDDMDQLYHDDVVFKDPINDINGMTGLHSYLTELCNSVTECRFEYLDEVVSDGSAYIKWNMHYRHPKLGNKLLVLRGMSHIQFGDRIIYHEDVYDMGQMIYEHVPLLGGIIRWLKERLKV